MKILVKINQKINMMITLKNSKLKNYYNKKNNKKRKKCIQNNKKNLL